jgi:hypothetical protein
MDKANRERLKAKASEQKKPPTAKEFGDVSSFAEPADGIVPPKKEFGFTAPQLLGLPPTRVVYTCGHEGCNVLCDACFAKRKQAKAQKRRESKFRKSDVQRLPDGATFDVKFDAAAGMWRGTLIIGDAPFESEASGVFRLLQNLDAMYRKANKL